MGLFDARALSGVVALGLAAGCAGEIEMPEDPGPAAEEECTDPGYGDGTCDTELSCAAPDIDCYVTFQTQAEVEDWFRPIEEGSAAAVGRPPYTFVSTSDARWTRMRDLLDQGWEAYKQVNAVGDLAPFTPALVVLETTELNAFAASSSASGVPQIGLAVIVYTGLIESLTDEELLGVVMHELTHGLRMHVIQEVKDRIRTYYVADDGEPFGFQQVDDPMAREHLETWRALAREAGHFDQEAVDIMPLSGGMDVPALYRIFSHVLEGALDANPTACSGPISQYDQLRVQILGTYSKLDQHLQIEGQEADVAAAVNTALVAVRDQCLPDFTLGFVDVLAEMNGVSAADIRAGLADSDEALVDGKHFVEAVATLLADRRAKMRAIEAAFTEASGVSWSRVRFFTTEEDADDSTVPIMEAIGLAPDGIGGGLFKLLRDEATQSQCQSILDAGDVPAYGANMLDEHHADCYRVHHVQDVAASGVMRQRAARRPVRQDAPVVEARHQPIPLPRDPWVIMD